MPEHMPPILIVDLAQRYGGADVRVLQLARAFEARSLDYCIATLDGSDLHQRLKNANLSHVPVPYKRSDPRIALYLRQVTQERAIGIIDAHNPQSQLWAHLGTSGADVRHISTMHSSYRLEHDGSLKGYAYEQVITLNHWQNSHFIAVSDAVYQYLTQTVKLPAERVTIIPNGIEVPANIPPRQRHPLWDQWGWSEDVRVAIAVGRLEAVKGHRYLIEAVASLHDQHPELRAVIVGEGRIEPELRERIADYGLEDVVKLTGFRDDIEALLLSSDYYLMPSLSEGLPYALLEAGALGLPALVSDVGGMSALLDHQQTAYLAPPEDAPAIARGLEQLLRQPEHADALAQALYRLIQTAYSLDSMVDRTLSYYLGE